MSKSQAVYQVFDAVVYVSEGNGCAVIAFCASEHESVNVSRIQNLARAEY